MTWPTSRAKIIWNKCKVKNKSTFCICLRNGKKNSDLWWEKTVIDFWGEENSDWLLMWENNDWWLLRWEKIVIIVVKKNWLTVVVRKNWLIVVVREKSDWLLRWKRAVIDFCERKLTVGVRESSDWPICYGLCLMPYAEVLFIKFNIVMDLGCRNETSLDRISRRYMQMTTCR